MNADARNALVTIRRCVAADRLMPTRHCEARLAERGVFWPDVLAVFDAPKSVEGDGFDDEGRARWIVAGRAAGPGVTETVSLVCAIGRDESGELTVIVTAFWGNRT